MNVKSSVMVLALSLGAAPLLAQSADLTPSDPVECSGIAKMVLRDIVIDTSEDTGIWVGGVCELVVINSTIKAADDGLWIGGGTTVILDNTTIEGGDHGLWIGGEANVTLQGSSITGSTAGAWVAGEGTLNVFDSSSSGMAVRGDGEIVELAEPVSLEGFGG